MQNWFHDNFKHQTFTFQLLVKINVFIGFLGQWLLTLKWVCQVFHIFTQTISNGWSGEK